VTSAAWRTFGEALAAQICVETLWNEVRTVIIRNRSGCIEYHVGN
jgi:hypothetical protein